MDCPKCGATNLAPGSSVCSYCGSVISASQASPAPVAAQYVQQVVTPLAQPDLSQIDASGVPEKYRAIFREIEQGGGGMTPKWNWYPFLFGALWYFSKSMWAKGLIILFILLGSSGLAVPLVWLYCGLLGSYDYYLLKVRGKQLW